MKEKWCEADSRSIRYDCCWCGEEISRTSTAKSIMGGFRKGVKPPSVKNEPHVIELKIPEAMDTNQLRTVWAIVIGKKSQAKKDGVDVMFQLCSEECARELGQILQAEIRFLDNLDY